MLFFYGNPLIFVEQTACNWNNTRQGLPVPIYAILCNGNSFEFFLFDGGAEPASFRRGCFPGDPRPLQRGLRISDVTLAETPGLFIRDLRLICETIFDLLLVSYVASLSAFWERSYNRGAKAGKLMCSLSSWDDTIDYANEALRLFRDAESQREAKLIALANGTAREALDNLGRRYGFSAVRSKIATKHSLSVLASQRCPRLTKQNLS
jgi:hypothetical protein